jgi:F-box/leucine-rich repeat protein 2/20
METAASSSKSNVPKRMAKTRKRKMAAEASYCSYLPQDELWECIFKLLDGDNHTLKSLSLVSKQFLSITNRLLFSLKITNKTIRFPSRLFRRFPNLTSLNITVSNKRKSRDFNAFLTKISSFLLPDIKSLYLSDMDCHINEGGLRALSQKMQNLTSLTCTRMVSINKSDLFFIADCFPLLEKLKLSYPSVRVRFDYKRREGDDDDHHHHQKLLALPKLRTIHLFGTDFDRQCIVDFCKNCELLQEVIVN